MNHAEAGKVRARVRLLERLPAHEIDLVCRDHYTHLMAARSALLASRDLGLVERVGAEWRRTPAGDRYVAEHREAA